MFRNFVALEERIKSRPRGKSQNVPKQGETEFCQCKYVSKEWRLFTEVSVEECGCPIVLGAHAYIKLQKRPKTFPTPKLPVLSSHYARFVVLWLQSNFVNMSLSAAITEPKHSEKQIRNWCPPIWEEFLVRPLQRQCGECHSHSKVRTWPASRSICLVCARGTRFSH